MVKRFMLYLRTARYLKPSQILWRVRYGFCRRFRLYRIPKAPDAVPFFNRECLRLAKAFLEESNRCGIHENGDMEALRNQSIRLLNVAPPDSGYIPWRDRAFSKLWRYQLHSFSFSRDFAVNAASEDYLGDRDRALGWMRDWIKNNPVGVDVGWDAWPVSERLLNWALLIAVFDLHDEDIRVAWCRQVRWLDRWIEYDVRANHLLTNVCALTVAACMLDEQALLNRVLPQLKSQFDEQILKDGGHYERSPMYHAQMLWNGMVVYAFLREKPPFLQDALLRMTGFLRLIRHPDGEIPLFGDSVLKQAPPTRALIALADQMFPVGEPVSNSSACGFALEDSGFYILGCADKGNHMIVKTAPPSPAFQPGHSHADMLSFELSVGGRRIIVDSGAHGYAESDLRAYCRSTGAHNTVQVGGLEQHELWGTFRCARRAQALPVTFQEDAGSVVLEAGYRHYTGYQHLRRISFDPAQQVWEIHDRLTGIAGEGVVRSILHFHPGCSVHADVNWLRVEAGGEKLTIEVLSGTCTEVLDAKTSPNKYCPEFGSTIAAPAAIFKTQNNPAQEIIYRISCSG